MRKNYVFFRIVLVFTLHIHITLKYIIILLIYNILLIKKYQMKVFFKQ